jgi:hypothetical protein
MSEFMTEAELASLVRSPPETVRFWRHKGQGPRWFRVGRRVLYDRGDVDRWLDEQRESYQ